MACFGVGTRYPASRTSINALVDLGNATCCPDTYWVEEHDIELPAHSPRTLSEMPVLRLKHHAFASFEIKCNTLFEIL